MTGESCLTPHITTHHIITLRTRITIPIIRRTIILGGDTGRTPIGEAIRGITVQAGQQALSPAHTRTNERQSI